MVSEQQSNLFSFMTVRPPASLAGHDLAQAVAADHRVFQETPVGRIVASTALGAERASALDGMTKAEGLGGELTDSGNDRRWRDLNGAVQLIPAEKVSTATIEEAVLGVFGQRARDVLADKATDDVRHRAWDAYTAVVADVDHPRDVGIVVRTIRMIQLLDRVAAGDDLDAAARDRILSAIPLVSGEIFASSAAPNAIVPKADPRRTAELTALWNELVEVNDALEAARSLPLRREEKTIEETRDIPNRSTGVADHVTSVHVTGSSVVDADAFEALPATTRALLGGRADGLSVPGSVTALTERLRSLQITLAHTTDPLIMELMPARAFKIPGLASLASSGVLDSLGRGIPGLYQGNIRDLIRPLGIGDLKVVKQRLRAYMLGEVAHIENVLRGEHRERRHRVLDRSEDQMTSSVETDETHERDTQSTERFELKRESERTIQEQTSVEAGVTVSGSYGPVTIGAHADFATSSATSESDKSASNYAREVVEKAVEKIQKKTKEERVRKTLHEVEELNVHGIDNVGKDDGVTGVYRWVDKQYEAQVYNYGKRLMYELIVPEPGAFLEWAKTVRPSDIAAPPTLDPTFTHREINETNYKTYLRDYSVQGITPPPPPYRTISTTLVSEAAIANGASIGKSSNELAIPDGYQVRSIDYSASFLYQFYPNIRVSIGPDDMWLLYDNNTIKRRVDFSSGNPNVVVINGVVPVSLVCYDVNAFYLHVVVTAERTPAHYESWQIATFEKIQSAYRDSVALYEQKLNAQEAKRGPVVISGHNPTMNRVIERTELRKHCTQMLLDTSIFGSFNAMRTKDGYAPEFDIKDAAQEGSTIQFIEQAFEWENLTYLCYPYFWGRRNQWQHKATLSDPDPLFQQFLQAGAARVLIPVRPAYNDAVRVFLESGQLWGGGDGAPTLGDPLYSSLADELKHQTDDLENAVAEGDPWEVILPTTLVYLQADSTLPTFP